MKRTMRGFMLAACFAAAFFAFGITGAVASGDCDNCEYITTGGDVWIDAGQYQEYFPEITGCNSAFTEGYGVQTIEAWGYGDHITSVSAEAQLIQYEPYHVTVPMPLGQAEHFGESYMNVYGTAGTDPWCRSLGIDIISGRDFATETGMTENTMESSISAGAYLDARVEGAAGTTDFAAVNEQITGYRLERFDGAWQQGMTKTSIQSGTLPQ